jgi:alpha-galactosidase/6-phospho-beta-glucosidase family protein
LRGYSAKRLHTSEIVARNVARTLKAHPRIESTTDRRAALDGVIEDLYPRIHQVISEGRVPLENQVRYDMLQRLGYFVTESSEHFSEYVPWFIKRDHIYHAAMLDPHTAAELDLDQIWSLVDELITAHEHWLPEYY